MTEKAPERTAGDRAGSEKRAARVERQLAVAQQITHIGSWEWDLASNAVIWSDELYRIYGLEPQSCEITFERFLSKLHPEDRERVQREVGLALERGGRFAYPERIVRPDGSIRQLDTVGEAEHDASGRVVGLIGTCRDVTIERKRDETLRLYADIVRNVQIGLTVWAVADAEQPGSARLVAFNPEAERVVRRELRAALGASVLELFPATDGGLLGAIGEVARTGEIREVTDDRLARADHDARVFAIKIFPLPSRCIGLAFEDVSAQARARRIQAAEQRVLERIAGGDSLSEVLTALVLAIEALAPPTIGSILLLDASGMRVRQGAAPNLPAEYNLAIDGAPIGPKAGSCGTAAFLKQPVFVHDIERDPLWDDYRELARRFALRACWSTPIMSSDGKVLGTFALYYRQPRGPSTDELELISRATHVARIAIERRQLDDQLRALSAHIEAVREQERTGIAREIHDELGQALTALSMDLAWIARRAAASPSLTSEVLMERIEPMMRMTEEVVGQVRRISAELRPGVLDDLGLLAAIEWQAQEFEKRSGVPCCVTSTLGEVRLERNLSTAAFRIFQEALTNVARHANARRVDVELDCCDGKLRMRIHDDGGGIAPEAVNDPRSLGLLGMRERSRRLGGSAAISGAPGQGTLVAIELPLVPVAAGGAS